MHLSSELFSGPVPSHQCSLAPMDITQFESFQNEYGEICAVQ
jgi:hypothetical protein